MNWVAVSNSEVSKLRLGALTYPGPHPPNCSALLLKDIWNLPREWWKETRKWRVKHSGSRNSGRGKGNYRLVSIMKNLIYQAWESVLHLVNNQGLFISNSLSSVNWDALGLSRAQGFSKNIEHISKYRSKRLTLLWSEWKNVNPVTQIHWSSTRSHFVCQQVMSPTGKTKMPQKDKGKHTLLPKDWPPSLRSQITQRLGLELRRSSFITLLGKRDTQQDSAFKTVNPSRGWGRGII